MGPYKTAYEQSKLAKNFKLRLANIEKQYEDEPFHLPDDIKELWEDQVKQNRQDREASETKMVIEKEPPTEDKPSEESDQ